jgi:hypothetical protein
MDRLASHYGGSRGYDRRVSDSDRYDDRDRYDSDRSPGGGAHRPR